MSWFLYLIECADGSVYTGITTDVAARFDEHAAGKGARYTRSRKPRAVLASFPLADRSSASRAEYWVKQLSPKQKRELAAGTRTLKSVLPVVVEVDTGTEETAEPAGGARKRANSGTRAAGARRKRAAVADADAMAEDAPVAVMAGTDGSNGVLPKRGRTPAKASPTPVNKAAKAATKKIAAPAGAAADSNAAAPKRSRAAATTSSPVASPAIKTKSTRRPAPRKNDAASPVATAPSPAPKTKKTARTKQNRAAS